MSGIVKFIPADSGQPIVEEPGPITLAGNNEAVEVDREYWFERARQYVGGWVELVWVLHNDRRTLMLVNEEGHILKPPLPLNARATFIYHANGKSQGRDMRGAPLICGNVVLFENIPAD